jgi:hypothetical protein
MGTGGIQKKEALNARVISAKHLLRELTCKGLQCSLNVLTRHVCKEEVGLLSLSEGWGGAGFYVFSGVVD